jgi:hypothetical protein
MDTKFHIYTVSPLMDKPTMGSFPYTHWATDLEMVIVKDGVEIRLTSEELKKLVKCLPRTIGGRY